MIFIWFIIAGGYYVIEQARLQLHLVALNTNFYSEQNMLMTDPEEIDPAGQWAWLEEILLKARRRRGTVRITSSISSNSFNSSITHPSLTISPNLLSIVNWLLYIYWVLSKSDAVL